MPSQQLVEIILKAQDQASATAKKVDDSIKGIGKSSSMLSKIPGFDTLKTKLGNVATSIDGRFGGALTRARNRISTFGNSIKSVGSTIKGKFSGAIDGVRSKLSSFSNGAKSAAGGLNFLKGAASMTVGMIGYDLVSSLVDSTRASMNARQSIQAFGSRLSMSGTEVSKFQADLDKLQGTFKKVDMDVVGQQAMDMAYRLGLPKTSLSELTETSAIFTDAMARNGRSAEDATLALADAMDGEFKRLKEIGISQDDLMKNGWSGDINDKTGLLNAMNKALKDQHYDELAKSVDTLDDAWQVLSITLSNLLESVLLPITPAIVGVINGIIGLIDGLKSAWNGLPDFAQLGIGIGLVAGAIVFVALVLWSTYIPAWIAAATATWAALAPILPIVLAVAAVVGILVAAIYEVGKAFGWWTDVDSMFEAIRNNVGRLWDAFINHPDVQATIAAISNALKVLGDWITQAGQAIMEFFGVSTGGEWDVTRSIIDGIGIVWQGLTAHIRLAIQIIQAVVGAFQWLYSSAVSLGGYLSDVLSPAFSFLSALWGTLVEAVQPIVTVFQQFQDGQVGLVDVITTVASSLWNVWTILSSNLSNLILTLVGNLLTWAIQGGLNFLTGLLTYLSQLPGRVAIFLGQVLSRITSYGARWVAMARVKANLLLLGIVSYLRQLPGRALSALLGVVTAIVSAGTQWVTNAKNKAKAVVDGVGNTLSNTASAVANALNGVKDAVVKPFQDAYNQAKQWWDKIANLGNNAAGFDFTWTPPSAAGFELSDVNVGAGNVSTSSSNVQKLEVEANLTHDFRNLPNGVTAEEVARIVQDSTTDDSFVKKLANNITFQREDSKVKAVLTAKNNRARGI